MITGTDIHGITTRAGNGRYIKLKNVLYLVYHSHHNPNDSLKESIEGIIPTPHHVDPSRKGQKYVILEHFGGDILTII